MTRLTVFLISICLGLHAYANDSSLEARVSQLEQQLNQLKQQVADLEKRANQPPTASPTLPAEPAPQPPPAAASSQAASKQLALQGWSYRETKIKFNTYYALDVELHNGFTKAITQIDGRIKFSNQFGGHLYSVTITPDLRIPAGGSVVDLGTRENRRLLGRGHQMRSLKPHEINANLLVRKIVFADGSSLDF